MENCLHEIYLHQIPYRKYPTYILGMENSLQENFLQLPRILSLQLVENCHFTLEASSLAPFGIGIEWVSIAPAAIVNPKSTLTKHEEKNRKHLTLTQGQSICVKILSDRSCRQSFNYVLRNSTF